MSRDRDRSRSRHSNAMERVKVSVSDEVSFDYVISPIRSYLSGIQIQIQIQKTIRPVQSPQLVGITVVGTHVLILILILPRF